VPPPLAAKQHTARGQALNGFAQRGARHAQLFGQLTFRWQTVAGFERAFQDHALQLMHDGVGKFGHVNALNGHFMCGHGSLFL
jgi:hypothetical protein